MTKNQLTETATRIMTNLVAEESQTLKGLDAGAAQGHIDLLAKISVFSAHKILAEAEEYCDANDIVNPKKASPARSKRTE